ncbi:RES domain-containing protein [Pseudomonas sp. PIC25]|uniref:RES domain-containing protein n=1 Tax=Pseudomonas sp. PIC25 TaxID=1958773 RepID=UPI00157F8A24|nr:RES domain-containing protein [Pseudomonas sp. PIC25]
MGYGASFMDAKRTLHLIVPSAVLPLERNIVLNPRHPAISRVKVIEVDDFTYERMFLARS